MNEMSYGIIPLQKRGGEWWVFLIQHGKGRHWAFPKGHSERGETSQQTAERELFEETGLTVQRYLTAPPLHESYSFFRAHQRVHKGVTYFLAEVSGEVALQAAEILNGSWVKLSEAPDRLTFPESRGICLQAIKISSSLT